MSTRKHQLTNLIRDKEFRPEFVDDYAQEILATQIRAIRENKQWTQQELGNASGGMKQAQVSRLEDPDYSGTTIKSLKRLARAFDLGLMVRFVRFTEFVDWIVEQSPDRFVPPSYDEEQQMSFAGFTGDPIWPYAEESGTYDTLPDDAPQIGGFDVAGIPTWGVLDTNVFFVGYSGEQGNLEGNLSLRLMKMRTLPGEVIEMLDASSALPAKVSAHAVTG